MKSTYAPLPFSYLSSDAKPKVGLRKDGVYGTSADFVPRSTNQPEGADVGDISMSTEYPYSVYANANALNPEGTAADYRGNQHQQQTADRPPYSQNGGGLPRFLEATSHRPQKPEGGFQVYPPSSSKYDEPPSSGRVSPKEVDLERKGDHGYRGLPVVKRTHEQLDRSNGVGRVPSHYPPVGNNFDRQVNGVESPYTYTMEPKEKQQPTTAVMAKDFDNFILVKDPNRPDSVVVIPEANPPSSANNDPKRNNNLQTLFEAGEPRRQQLPRYNAQQLPPENHYDSSGPSRGEESNTRHNQEVSASDRSNYAIYNGHAQQPGPVFVTAATKPEPPIYRGNGSGVVQPDNHHRSSDTRLVKDSDSGSDRTSDCCCGCGKCTSVVIAIIVTAIICLGAGFVAGWFGARAAGIDTSTDSSPSQLIFANLSTVTTMAERVSSTKPSAISSTKASATPSSSKPSAISSAKAQLVTSTIERRAAISTTVHSGK